MTVHGYEIISEWKNSQCGQTAIARRGDRQFFIKKYQTPVEPIDNGTLDAKTFAHNKELFEKFVSTRKRINATIRSMSGAGGNIVIPCEEFIVDNHYMEAAELVEGVVDEEELEGVLKSLSVDVKKLLMQTAAGALQSVHTKHIVHSDLKLKNVLLVRNAAGNYVAKLIDFDSSYFVDEKPDEVVGTIDYYSPELGAYADIEDEEEREIVGRKLTEKSDIFSLGLIFHFYLSGELPKPADLTEKLRKRAEKGKIIYCWVALLNGCSLELSPVIKSSKYRSLISDMLNADPDQRPAAIEVLKRLREEESTFEEPWPEHGILLDKTELKNAGVEGLIKIESGGKKYELRYTGGRKTILTKEELEDHGFVKPSAGFCPPFEEHHIEFNQERIRSRGFVSVARKIVSGIRGYKFTRADSSSTFFKVKDLIAMKYAVEVPKASAGAGPAASEAVSAPVVEAGIAAPWPEHKIAFDESAVNAKGFIRVERDILGGVNGYRLFRPDGTNQFLRVEMVLVQKLAKKS